MGPEAVGVGAECTCIVPPFPRQRPRPAPTPDSVIARILPAKAELTLLKLSNRASAYASGGVPMFFDVDGRGGALLPTVYALWASGHARLLPEVVTYSEVSPKASRGVVGGWGGGRRAPPPLDPSRGVTLREE